MISHWHSMIALCKNPLGSRSVFKWETLFLIETVMRRHLIMNSAHVHTMKFEERRYKIDVRTAQTDYYAHYNLY